MLERYVDFRRTLVSNVEQVLAEKALEWVREPNEDKLRIVQKGQQLLELIKDEELIFLFDHCTKSVIVGTTFLEQRPPSDVPAPQTP